MQHFDISKIPQRVNIYANAKSRRVYLNSAELKPAYSQKIRNHSPDGFAWGYSGSGPAQLALAILLHYTNISIATLLYQEFKNIYVASWNADSNICLDLNLQFIVEDLLIANENAAAS